LISTAIEYTKEIGVGYKMKSDDKTREKHLKEIENLNKKIAELEKSESERLSTARLPDGQEQAGKQAETALKVAQRYTRGLIEANLDALVTISAKGKITDVNIATELITGMSRKEIIGTDFSNYFTDPNAARKGYQQVFRDGYIRDYSLEIKHRDGRVTPVLYNASVYKDAQGNIAGVFAAARNITERKQAEAALQESEEKFHTVSDFTYDWEYWIDPKEKLIYISPSCKRITGYSAKEFIQNPQLLTEIVHPDDAVIVKNHIHKVLGTGEIEPIEFRIITKNKEERWIGHVCQAVYDKNLVNIGQRSSNRDITERKQSEEKLKNTLAELQKLKDQIEKENIYLKEEIKLEHNFGEIVGQSIALKKMLNQVELVSNTDTFVMILGETGTGKELVARAIHGLSNRKDKPLVKVNCSALPKELIESELFGHEKGAFTGAIERKIGRFELADKGTIFLDEICDLPLNLQSRLLRVLQENEFERVGNSTTIKVNVRVIAATNRNLENLVLNGDFRQDLYYRLNVFPIRCPSLNERKEDIPLLVKHFVNKYSLQKGKRIKTVPQNVIKNLQDYHWPGNVRELENVIERAMVISQGDRLHIGGWLIQSPHTYEGKAMPTLTELEKDYVIRVLEKTNWRIRGKNGAAQILGLKPTTLESRMQRLDIKR